MNMLLPGSDEAGVSLSRPANSMSKPVVISNDRSFSSRWRAAFNDLKDTFRLAPLVWTLSLFDIRLRYRGSLLGPFWLTLSTGVMIGAIGIVYSQLFGQDMSKYLPFLAVSLVLWGFISTITAEGATCLTSSETMIRSMRMPHTLHAARVVVRNLLVLAHNLIAIVVVFLLFPQHLSWPVLSLPAALLLWAVDCMAVAVLLGVIGARFRDVPPIVGSIMQIAFYVTPIIWGPDMLIRRGVGIGRALIDFNPFYGLLEIIRGPLLGLPFDNLAWINALSYSVVLIIAASLLFMRARPRIPYWV